MDSTAVYSFCGFDEEESRITQDRAVSDPELPDGSSDTGHSTGKQRTFDSARARLAGVAGPAKDLTPRTQPTTISSRPRRR
jgi:hypothetical protein